MLIDELNNGGHPKPDPIQFLGPLWLLEHYHLTDCLDVVLELLRQDAWFYSAYNDHCPEALSAALCQLGSDKPEVLKDMLYEQGLIPLSKPIVFNALTAIAIRHPQKRLAIIAMIAAYLNHCLKNGTQETTAHNIKTFAYSLAYMHIDEMRPILKRLYTEIDELDQKDLKEIEDIFNTPDDHLEDKLGDSIDYYLRFYEEKEKEAEAEAEWEDEWEDGYHDEDYTNAEEEEIQDAGIFNRREPQKRYTIRMELLGAPQPVERTLQIPSNIRLDALAELLMHAFGRVDAPTNYAYQMGDELYPGSHCNNFTLGDLLKKKNQTARLDIWNPTTEVHWQHGLVLEKAAEYSKSATHFIDLLDGRGCYPPASMPDMEAYTQRVMAGKLRQPDFKSAREQIREFEENNGLPF